ncbi:TIGR03085 family protein [Skermania sp. ID1734]|uniref:TIGR03085 family metal-binding protein n=1 Tax=Skermania sp. ID1734 TaxID=2597516 RepID=UPI0011814BEF|nr:TIGR03085 family metal-binding protein [Skermania sp. ID1734]TSD96084.1 TIGR03085 family protein [Skermania sp. ID1734]
MTLAQRERQALAATMAETGPDAPTLCGDWTVRDLAAHLVIRERRPDTGPGILIKQLAGYTERVRRKVAREEFAHLLDQIRSGPPVWSPLRPVDTFANTTEMFVHHEDVRRGRPGWEPRRLDDRDEATLWSAVRRMGRMAYRSAPVTVVLATPDGRREVVHKGGDSTVTITAKPSELLLHAFGRDEVRIEATGEPHAVQAVLGLDRSI